MNSLRQSLGTKVLLLTSLLTIIAFTGLFLANSYWQRTATMEEIEISAVRTAELLQMAIEEPMVLGDNEATALQMEKVADRNKDVKIFLTNWRGNITYSTDKSVIRTDLSTLCDDEFFLEKLEDSLKAPTKEGGLIELQGSTHFVEFESIKNEPACYHCHGKSKPILGTMLMCQDVTRQLATLENDQYKSAAISLVGLAALLTALLIFMKTSVVNRIKHITESTEDVSRGQPGCRFCGFRPR